MSKNCIEIKDPIVIFMPGEAKPDHHCINCILDDILKFPEGEQRDLRISLYRAGLMQLNCEKTGKSFHVNKDFFDQIFSQ
jgi:hypothetical protein